MIDEKHSLVAFVAVLIAIVILVAIAAVLCALQRPYEAIGVGGAVTGLIGVLGTFRPSKADAGTSNDPGATPSP